MVSGSIQATHLKYALSFNLGESRLYVVLSHALVQSALRYLLIVWNIGSDMQQVLNVQDWLDLGRFLHNSVIIKRLALPSLK